MRKQSSNWYIAMTHYLTAGFVVPIIAFLFIGLFLDPLLKLPTLAAILVDLMITCLAIWLATRYSANYLYKTYIIKEKDKTVRLSTIYFGVLWGAVLIFRCFFPFLLGNWQLITVNIINFIASIFVFYFASKKYIKNTELQQTTEHTNIPIQNT